VVGRYPSFRVPSLHPKGTRHVGEVDRVGYDEAYFSPRVLIELVDLEGAAVHRLGWSAIV
jgi:hypothetical protein